MQVVILAGGKGTRLAPLTDALPKALVPVAGRPFADRQLALLRSNGATRILYSVGHMGERIRAHVGDGRRFGLAVDYVEDGDVPLGTGGPLRVALDAGLLEQRFLVTYGDSYLPIDLAPVMAALAASSAPALMTVFRNGGRWDGSNVAFAAGRIILYDKRGRHPEVVLDHIDYGMLALTRSFVAGLAVTTRFWEIGGHAGLAELEAAIAAGTVPAP